LQCVAVCCSVLQCVAVCCSVLQCVAVCCSVLQCVAIGGDMPNRVGIWVEQIGTAGFVGLEREGENGSYCQQSTKRFVDLWFVLSAIADTNLWFVLSTIRVDTQQCESISTNLCRRHRQEDQKGERKKKGWGKKRGIRGGWRTNGWVII